MCCVDIISPDLSKCLSRKLKSRRECVICTKIRRGFIIIMEMIEEDDLGLRDEVSFFSAHLINSPAEDMKLH